MKFDGPSDFYLLDPRTGKRERRLSAEERDEHLRAALLRLRKVGFSVAEAGAWLGMDADEARKLLGGG